MAVSANGTGSANLDSARSGPVVFSTILRKQATLRERATDGLDARGQGGTDRSRRPVVSLAGTHSSILVVCCAPVLVLARVRSQRWSARPCAGCSLSP